ncbi:MAG: low molecular weight phosphatase family protein [Actinobacteria bacterium]|nr:MAG: low molecular weight phosphatase family protein [Actinomycetota bacterium]
MGHGLLFVCHANVCRSPMAEYLAREMLAQALGGDGASVPVSSAGTHAVPGHAMHPHAAQLAAERAIDIRGFRSRPITPEDLVNAGIVLTATREQRSACVAMAPSVIRRTFTLRQFSRLVTAAVERGWRVADADQPPPARISALVTAAGRARALVQPVRASEDDLPDPIGQPLAQFRRCARDIEAALTPIIGAIAGSG